MQRVGFLLAMMAFVGLVVGQCKDDEGQKSISYGGPDGLCQMESLEDNTVYKCKNFLACHHPDKDHPVPFCGASKEPRFADYPYGERCGKGIPGAVACPSPLVCNNHLTCDYENLPNGYACVSDRQCASDTCSEKFCVKAENKEGECEKDDDCSSTQFCNAGECAASLHLGDNCTGFEDSLKQTVSRVCEPGTGCLPGKNSSKSYSCQPLFSGSYGGYCADSAYKCPYGQYCNQETNKCDYLAIYDGTNLPDSCSTSSPLGCPNGFKCSCTAETSETGEGKCENFINTYCSTFHGKYLSCMTKKGCYFDANTLINNGERNNSEFIQPLNRYSCASQCQYFYNKFIKCQNLGIESPLSPAFVPKFSHHEDAVWKGYEVALLTIGVLITMVVLASSAVCLCQPKIHFEDGQ